MTINTRAPGVEAGIERYPDDDVCVILLTNVFSSLSHSAADDLAAVALGHDCISPAPRARVVVPADTLSGTLFATSSDGLHQRTHHRRGLANADGNRTRGGHIGPARPPDTAERQRVPRSHVWW